MLPERDAGYLLDMLIAARQVQRYVRDLEGSKAAFLGSEVYQDAITRQVQIIGEAAFQVSQKTKARIPSIDWRQVEGMRHRLVHDYRNVRLDIVWQTATDDMQPLIDTLEPLIPPPDSPSD